MTTAAHASPPAEVLERYALEPGQLTLIPAGLINTSWLATRGSERFVLQRMHAIWPPETQHDTDVITRHLESRGQPTTRIVPDNSGALYAEHDGRIWRMLSYIEGVTRDALDNDTQAREAGRLLADFHSAGTELDYSPTSRRANVHDLPRHVENLRKALEIHYTHPEHAAVADIASELLSLAGALPPLAPTPPRLVHGDPKISNIVFNADTDAAICLIDLDTLARMPIVFELGDALRSWCNKSAEDAREAAFSTTLFEAACAGYASHARFLDDEEWQQIPLATLTITLELAIRFCADALEENYFGWDPSRFKTRSRHNQTRARNQLDLARQIAAANPTLTKIVERHFTH